LQAEGRGGELGDGTLHSLLVKKLADSQVESYSRWLGEHKKDKSVLTLRDWLKEEVRASKSSQWKWHMGLRLSLLEVLRMVVSMVIEVVEAGVFSVKTVTLVKKHPF